MSRYIDADKLLLDIQQNVKFGQLTICALINAQPTADVRKVVKGEWLTKDGRASWIECSVCEWHGYILGHIYHYCPWCGADMGGKKNAE